MTQPANNTHEVFQTSQYIYYRPTNAPELPVVLITGLFAGDWIWEKTIACFQAQHISYILLLEPLASIGANIAALRQHLKAILDELNIYRSILVGNSYGGLLAIDLAVTFPERVKAIVASGAPGMSNNPGLNIGALGISRTVSRTFALKVAHQLFYDQNIITEEMLTRTLTTFSNSAILLNMIRLLKSERKYDMRTILPRIECDTLLIWGANDVITPPTEWEQSQSLLKKGALKVIADCGHTTMMEQPALFNALLLEFLTATRGATEQSVAS